MLVIQKITRPQTTCHSHCFSRVRGEDDRLAAAIGGTCGRSCELYSGLGWQTQAKNEITNFAMRVPCERRARFPSFLQTALQFRFSEHSSVRARGACSLSRTSMEHRMTGMDARNSRARYRSPLPVFGMAIAAMAALSASQAMAAEAFNALKGNWSGGGSVTFQSGETEKMRCTGHYGGGGSSLAMNIRCASPSAQINLSGDLSGSGNSVSGSWHESSYGLSGGASGSASANAIRLRISGDAKGSMVVNVSGSRQSVALSTSGTTVTGVNVSMSRR
jgi:hypothetical protein